jgi:hypothetical protein
LDSEIAASGFSSPASAPAAWKGGNKGILIDFYKLKGVCQLNFP